jgi:hypothetical protein
VANLTGHTPTVTEKVVGVFVRFFVRRFNGDQPGR